MVALGTAFDPNSVGERTSRDPIPPGTYHVGITKATIEASKKNPQNQMVVVEMAVKGGEHDGRLLWSRMNTHHENAQTREIAWKELGELGRAIGLPVIDDTDQLVGRELLVEIVIRPGQGEYGPSNEVKKYQPLSGGTPAAGQPAGASGAPAVKKPWER